MSANTLLTVGVGDIHGRFHRVQGWLESLEAALGRPVDLCFAVGDVEAFAKADDHRRKAAKRTMPAEFSDYSAGARALHRPLYFIAGNNEDFEALHGLQGGGDLLPEAHYLGRAGSRTLQGLKVTYLSGIFAPRFYEQPLAEPKTRETAKQAGYFRKTEVESLHLVAGTALLLVHEWPRGLFTGAPSVGGATLRPWMGNRVTQELVSRLKPQWLWCGHSHTPWAATLHHPGGEQTYVSCLDQAARPEGSVFWVEWKSGIAVRAGWGIDGKASWQAGQTWDFHRIPPPAMPPTSERSST